eukprot:2141130-Pleurochrysis_carterae.AAC.1
MDSSRRTLVLATAVIPKTSLIRRAQDSARAAASQRAVSSPASPTLRARKNEREGGGEEGADVSRCSKTTLCSEIRQSAQRPGMVAPHLDV